MGTKISWIVCLMVLIIVLGSTAEARNWGRPGLFRGLCKGICKKYVRHVRKDEVMTEAFKSANAILLSVNFRITNKGISCKCFV